MDGPIQPAYLYTDNGGTTWQRQSWHEVPVVEHLYFRDPSHGWAVGPHGVVARYHATWQVEALYNANQLDKADAALKALGESPDSVSLRALLQARQGQTDAAMQTLSQAGTLDSQSLYVKAVLEHATGHDDDALNDARAACEQDPNNADAYYLRGLLVENSPEPKLAVPYFQRYLILAPDGVHSTHATGEIERVSRLPQGK
jgi:tetratricopeptide (TPR) repeat protein